MSMARAAVRTLAVAAALTVAGIVLGAAWAMYHTPLMSILGSTMNFCG
ncbi:MAG: hypothetical protein H7Z12_07145 [Rhodospirillaceae bacterium]|nr:hypothetical protein [Rhodospirillales bacterium]